MFLVLALLDFTGLLRMDNDEELYEERRQKGCGELSEYTRLARQGGHKGVLFYAF